MTPQTSTSTIYQERNSNRRFTINAELMKKDNYNYRAVCLPYVQEKDEVLLFNALWDEDGQHYLIVHQKYLEARRPRT